jgi:hypothetical protein
LGGPANALLPPANPALRPPYTCPPHLPPAVVSNQDSRDVVLKCLSSGAADYWVRPIRPNEIRMLWTRVWRGSQVRLAAAAAGRPQFVPRRATLLPSLPWQAFPLPPAAPTFSQLPARLPACLQPPGQLPASDDSNSGNSTDAAA